MSRKPLGGGEALYTLFALIVAACCFGRWQGSEAAGWFMFFALDLVISPIRRIST